MGCSQHSAPLPQQSLLTLQILCNGNITSKALCPHPVCAKSKVNTAKYVLWCSQISSVYSYYCRHNPCHATMMLPGTYWALVESILYSSWYLGTAHMDTDRHRFSREWDWESRKGKKRARKGCHSGYHWNWFAFTCILSQNATIL